MNHSNPANCRDRYLVRVRIACPADLVEPGANACHRERGRIVCDAEADPSCICGDVVHPVRGHLADFFVGKVVYIHAQGIAFRPPVTAGVAVVADQLFPLGINRDHGLAGGPGRKHLGIDVLELGVAIGMVRALIGLRVGLARESQLGDEHANGVGTDRGPCQQAQMRASRDSSTPTAAGAPDRPMCPVPRGV